MLDSGVRRNDGWEGWNDGLGGWGNGGRGCGNVGVAANLAARVGEMAAGYWAV